VKLPLEWVGTRDSSIGVQAVSGNRGRQVTDSPAGRQLDSQQWDQLDAPKFTGTKLAEIRGYTRSGETAFVAQVQVQVLPPT
jgi:hypothetical protein